MTLVLRRARALRALPLLLALVSCRGEPGAVIEVIVPAGAPLSVVADTLSARGVIGAKTPFELFARMRGLDRQIKSGRYELRESSAWGVVLERLTLGNVMTVPMTIPEGFQLRQMAPRIAAITGDTEEAVLARLVDPDLARDLGVPGPGVEGYLFPDTYLFAPGVPVDAVLIAMVDRYKTMWSSEWRARLDDLGMSEIELVTLASIIQAEARQNDEMPRIASVYHVRLREGWLLQADPTVLYALGGTRQRLLYAAIDSVEDNPYNTYSQPGLPPGPIGAPGEAALTAALNPAPETFMYFVARPDGTHVFTRTLVEHNRAKASAQAERDRVGGGAQDAPEAP